MPFALVQRSLEQTIERKVLEECSVFVPGVARADCARIHRELFGIVVDNLSRNDAIAFQTALEHFGFSTDIVAQEHLPVLPVPVVRRGICLEGGGFVAIDGIGREQRFSWENVHFAAGGFLDVMVRESKRVLRWDHHASGRYSGRAAGLSQSMRVENELGLAKEKAFRLELFLSCEPHRLQFAAGKESVFRFNDERLRLRQRDGFERLLRSVAGVLPEFFLNSGIRAAVDRRPFHYPSVAAFEEETVWRLYQRVRPE